MIETFICKNRLPYAYGGGPLPDTIEPLVKPGDLVFHEAIVGGETAEVVRVSDDNSMLWLRVKRDQVTIGIGWVQTVQRGPLTWVRKP